ncbi:MAG: GntR family transcriptional regulator, partial [Clostridia bacterium]|nr:GntR family transcriptional regulator [Clostridia bacterium]
AIGVISGGEKLPSVRSLALKFSINPNTVQKAYAILESGGIIYSVKGKGSFVSEDESAAQAVIDRAKKDFGAAVKSAREVGLDANTLTAIVKDIYKEEKIC